MTDIGLEEVTVKSTGPVYETQDLFPDAQKFGNNEAALYEYVREILDMLVKEKRLYLTDLFNQSSHLRELAGMVILGQRWDYSNDPPTMAIDPDVRSSDMQDYKIKIRSLTGKAITWKKGLEPTPGKQYSHVWTGKRGGPNSHVTEIWFKTSKTEIDLPIHLAWNCLRQYGRYCARARTLEDQKTIWRYEEVKPDGEDHAVRRKKQES